MHLMVVLFTLFAAWRWGDWRNWKKYHTTMLYMAVGNLLYNFIYSDHLLWELKPTFLYNHMIGEMFYTFIVFPLTALLLLTNYPKEIRKQILRVVKFIVIYVMLEAVFQSYGRIVYKYGWNLWWSSAWNCMMFPMVVLHHKKPLAAYLASIFMVIIIVSLFPV